MTHVSPASGRIEGFVFLVCVTLSLVLLVLPTRVQIEVAGLLSDVITAPYYRTRNFVSDVGRVGRENAMLKARLAELELRMAAMRRTVADSVRGAGPALVQGFQGRLVPCRVDARKSARFANMIRIRSLATAPFKTYHAVISSSGFLGRIHELEDERTAWVELLASPDMALGVEIERTGLLAVLRPRVGSYVLDLVARDEDVRPGDRLVTSGIDEFRGSTALSEPLGYVPRGLPVGTVAGVAAPSDRIFKEVTVELLADFRFHETVFVVLPQTSGSEPSRPSGAEGS